MASLGLGQQQAALENPVWSKVKTSVLRIDQFGTTTGLGVLVDSKGNFLVHRSAFASEPVIGFLNETEPLILKLVAVDDQTQLALLHAENWIANNRGGVKVALKTPVGSSLVAATMVGPVRGELVSDQKVGQMRPSLRYAPLSEIRLESNLGKVGGAIVFDEQGGLVGLLGATLTTVERASNTGAPRGNAKSGSTAGGAGGGGGVSTDATEMIKKVTTNVFGPQGLTVAYSLGPTVLKRVVDGFLSKDHKVQHPSIGLFFKDAAQPGALVEVVMKDSPSEEAGLMVGDLIVEVNGQAVREPVDLAVQLFQANVGETLTVKLLRSGVEKTVTIRVGAQLLAD